MINSFFDILISRLDFRDGIFQRDWVKLLLCTHRRSVKMIIKNSGYFGFEELLKSIIIPLGNLYYSYIVFVLNFSFQLTL